MVSRVCEFVGSRRAGFSSSFSRVGLLVGLLSCAFAQGEAAAASFVYLSDDRVVNHSKAGGPIVPAAAYADFSGNFGSFEAGAQQFSSLHANRIQARGHAYEGVDAPLYGATASTRLDVTFMVADPIVVVLEGEISRELFSYGTATVSLRHDDDVLASFFVGEVYDPDTMTIFDETEADLGMQLALDPGVYRLIATADPSDSYGPNEGYEGAGFDFSLSVPEPSAGLLLGLALVAIATRGRQTRARG